MYEIINDAAQAYKGVIPEDRWQEPYMPIEELKHEMDDGVEFWGYEEAGNLIGVMGLQDKGDVYLIRHAYVYTGSQNHGIGRELLRHLEQNDRQADPGRYVGGCNLGHKILREERVSPSLPSETERLLKMYGRFQRGRWLLQSFWQIRNGRRMRRNRDDVQ